VFSRAPYRVIHDCRYDQPPDDPREIERLIEAAPPIFCEVVERAARRRPEDWI
jgi:hypothetical protein